MNVGTAVRVGFAYRRGFAFAERIDNRGKRKRKEELSSTRENCCRLCCP